MTIPHGLGGGYGSAEVQPERRPKGQDRSPGGLTTAWAPPSGLAPRRQTFAARCRDVSTGCRPFPLINAVQTKFLFPLSQHRTTIRSQQSVGHSKPGHTSVTAFCNIISLTRAEQPVKVATLTATQPGLFGRCQQNGWPPFLRSGNSGSRRRQLEIPVEWTTEARRKRIVTQFHHAVSIPLAKMSRLTRRFRG